MLTFGMVALNECNFIDTKLHCFFNKPFDAIGIFGRRDTNMNVKISGGFHFLFNNVKAALMRIWVGDDCFIKITFAIGDVYCITFLFTKYLNDMPGFIGVQIVYAFREPWLIKKIHLI